MYTVECSENFTINHTVKKEGEITYIDLTAQAIDAPGKLTLAVKWNYPLIGAHLTWSPIPYAVRGVTPTWGMDKTESNAMRSAPVRSYVAYDDTNGITVACSDAKNNVFTTVYDGNGKRRFGQDVTCGSSTGCKRNFA